MFNNYANWNEHHNLLNRLETIDETKKKKDYNFSKTILFCVELSINHEIIFR